MTTFGEELARLRLENDRLRRLRTEEQLQMENSALQRENNTLREENLRLREAEAELRQKNELLGKTVKALKELDELHRENERLQSENGLRLQQENEDLVEENRLLKTDIAALEEEIGLLREGLVPAELEAIADFLEIDPGERGSFSAFKRERIQAEASLEQLMEELKRREEELELRDVYDDPAIVTPVVEEDLKRLSDRLGQRKDDEP